MLENKEIRTAGPKIQPYRLQSMAHKTPKSISGVLFDYIVLDWQLGPASDHQPDHSHPLGMSAPMLI